MEADGETPECQEEPPPHERVEASAPGKVILFGEHAVVYYRPAIAVPIMQVKATVVAENGRPEAGVVIHAEDIGRRYMADAARPEEPLAYTCRTVLREFGIEAEPDVRLSLHSEIPIASGLGSGAATSAAMAKALARWLGHELPPDRLSAIVYETEKIHHGTPSGIDNTVVAYEQPIWFQRDQPIQMFKVGAPLTLLVADTGVYSPTRHSVSDVRQRWTENPARYDSLFDHIAEIAWQARAALQHGDGTRLGQLMNENHRWLVELGVSAPENDHLADAARAAGALGAKLSGGGRGGNNVALVRPEQAAAVTEALLAAGAVRVLQSTLEPRP
ncbi:MAG TPA: mevalonate kinase [Ardenticatenaceae bacterium]|jgi:mevalonate kinase